MVHESANWGQGDQVRRVVPLFAFGVVRVRFSAPSAASLEGLARIPGVAKLGYDGRIAEIAADPVATVPLASELERRELTPRDFTVIRPSLQDAVVPLLNGGLR